MKRSGFARPAFERPPRVFPTVAPGGLRGRYADADGGNVSTPKRDYVRSEKLLDAVRKLPCMHTGVVGLTEPAHSNWAVHGKGKGIKADDNRVAALAHHVHAELDQGSQLLEHERKALWWSAHVATVQRLLADRAWPDGVPIPDITTNPFA